MISRSSTIRRSGSIRSVASFAKTGQETAHDSGKRPVEKSQQQSSDESQLALKQMAYHGSPMMNFEEIGAGFNGGFEEGKGSGFEI